MLTRPGICGRCQNLKRVRRYTLVGFQNTLLVSPVSFCKRDLRGRKERNTGCVRGLTPPLRRLIRGVTKIKKLMDLNGEGGRRCYGYPPTKLKHSTKNDCLIAGQTNHGPGERTDGAAPEEIVDAHSRTRRVGERSTGFAKGGECKWTEGAEEVRLGNGELRFESGSQGGCGDGVEMGVHTPGLCCVFEGACGTILRVVAKRR